MLKIAKPRVGHADIEVVPPSDWDSNTRPPSHLTVKVTYPFPMDEDGTKVTRVWDVEYFEASDLSSATFEVAKVSSLNLSKEIVFGELALKPMLFNPSTTEKGKVAEELKKWLSEHTYFKLSQITVSYH